MKMKEEWGYYYEGRIYLHFDHRPDFKLLKYFRSVSLYNKDIIMPEGKIKYTIIPIDHSHHMGGSMITEFADPIFEWTKIK